jgi:hypothetical protein
MMDFVERGITCLFEMVLFLISAAAQNAAGNDDLGCNGESDLAQYTALSSGTSLPSFSIT